MHHLVRRSSVIVTGLVLAVIAVGCSGSQGFGGSAASKEVFCERLEKLLAETDSGDSAALATSLRDIAAVAPSSELRQAATQLAETYDLFAGVAPDDPEALDKAFGEFDEEKTTAAVTAIEAYALDECGIEDF